MAKLDTIDVEPRHLKMVRSIFARHLPYKKVWAYGSRVKHTASHTSDLDSVVFDATDSEIYNAQEAFDESDIPFEVQVLNWQTIPDDFKENIKKAYFVLRNKGDWKETTLGDISKDIAYGYTASAKQNPVGSKFLRITDIANGRLDWESVPYCEISERNTIKYHLESGDVVIARTGATTGATYTMKPKDPNNVVFASYLIRYRIDKSIADPSFIDFCLRSSFWKSYVVGIAGGSAQPGANAKQLASFEIALPPLPEQKAIAGVLSSLDDKIDLLHRQNKTLESTAETLFRQWFIEEVQDDWAEKPLGDLLTITSSKRIFYKEYVKSGIPFYRSKEIIELHNSGSTNGELFITTERFEEIKQKFSVPQVGDILLTSVGTLGIPYRVTTNDPFYFKDGNLTWFKDFQDIPSIIIYCWLKSSIGKEQLDAITIGSTQAALTIVGLKNITLTIPPSEKLNELEGKLNLVYDKVASNQKQIKTLESLRDTLLPKLISGAVRVAFESNQQAEAV